jgi:hypothetical protein
MMLALVASSAFFSLPTIFYRPLSDGSFPVKIAHVDEKDRAPCVSAHIEHYKILE